MALAAPQEPTQAGVPSIANSFSHAAAAMASMFPHQMFFPRNSCKAAVSAPPLSQFSAIDSSGSQLEADDVYAFLDDPSPLLLQCTPVQSVGAGLTNLGNTCFLNSVLQCLTYTPPLAALLQAGLHNISCKVKGFCAMCALERHVRDALSSNGRVLSPSYFVKNLCSVSRSFQMWRQEDAHEYMRYLIEALQRCCSLEFLGGRSLIESVFGGRLRSQVKCTQCAHCSNKYDPFLDLSLEVTRADSFHTALAHFTAIEVLDGDNKYHCGKCKTKVRALKQFTIDKAPPILTVQLKRFSSIGTYGGKIDKKIHFEREFDLKPFVNGSEDEDLSYSLYAVLVHSGWSTHSGHYYCYVRTARDTWHAMDDSQVSQVSESTVLAQKAYILFYVRNVKSTSPLINHIQKAADSLRTSFETSNHSEICKESVANNHIEKKADSLTSTIETSNHSEICKESVANKNSISPNSGLHFNTSNKGQDLTAAEQVHTLWKQNDVLRESALEESQELLTSQAVLETDEGNRFATLCKVDESINVVEDLDAVVISDLCENSWYRAVQAIKSSCISLNDSVESKVGKPGCLRHNDDAQERRCSCDQSACADDDLCRGGMQADSTCSDDSAHPGLDCDEVSTPVSECQRWRSIFNVMSPILRTSRMETTSHNAFSILCMCAKLCFWSCFWPPL